MTVPSWISLSSIADIVGLLSFIVSVIIWWKFNEVFYKQKTIFKKRRRGIENRLLGVRALLERSSALSALHVNELITDLYVYKRQYVKIFSFEDKQIISSTIKLLEHGTHYFENADNRLALMNNLNRIIYKFRMEDL